jgi:phage tail protein X
MKLTSIYNDLTKIKQLLGADFILMLCASIIHEFCDWNWIQIKSGIFSDPDSEKITIIEVTMKKQEEIIALAKEKFPNSTSTVEAVDLLAREVYGQLAAIKDKESEQFYKLAEYYQELRKTYKFLYRQQIEKESSYQKVI